MRVSRSVSKMLVNANFKGKLNYDFFSIYVTIIRTYTGSKVCIFDSPESLIYWYNNISITKGLHGIHMAGAFGV